MEPDAFFVGLFLCAHVQKIGAVDAVSRAGLGLFSDLMCERCVFMKKSAVKVLVLVAHRQGFRVLYEIENAGVGMCGERGRALPQKIAQNGITDSHRYAQDHTVFFCRHA